MRFVQGQAISYWTPHDEKPVELAVRDLGNDLNRTLSASFVRVPQPDQAQLILVNISEHPWPNLAITADGYEQYQIAVQQKYVVIAGSNLRGLLFGIYQFSERALNINPLTFWIPEAPPTRIDIDVLAAKIVSKSPRFTYRGWFINGEDFLEGWQYGSDRQWVDWYGERRKSISFEAYDKLFETMLRLRVNLIIPSSITDIEDPASAPVFEMIRDRGLLFSHHHVEPLGVCPWQGFDRYCDERGIEPHYDWFTNRQVVEDCWRRSIECYAGYSDQIIWQLGYRGRGDVPFWESIPNSPRDLPTRGRYLTEVIARQRELLDEVLGAGAKPRCTTTLWSEGNVLYEMGHLTLPDGVIAIIADVARSQMLPEPMPTQEPDRRYGIYYHTSYWSTGPHMIHGNPPANIFANYRRAIAQGAGDYVMQHVSNVRPFLPSLQAGAQIAWHGEDHDDGRFLPAFCERCFGQSQIHQDYLDYYQCFVHRGEAQLVQQNARWLDGSLVLMIRGLLTHLKNDRGLKPEGFKCFMETLAFRLQLLQTNDQSVESLTDAPWMCDSWDSLFEYIHPQLTMSIERWQQLINRANIRHSELQQGISMYETSILWPAMVGKTLTQLVLDLFEIGRSLNATNNNAYKQFMHAAESIDYILIRGKDLMEKKHFKNWLRGDRFVNLRGLQNELIELANQSDSVMHKQQ